ncbi:T9SS type A sorting domain-containing protein [Chryseobacterium sp. FH1]|uniref:T9SS type A sorting domain-containing protein n=1 Tax=Chryseobacterium sp. FH1 TaxID=1233951 RepID=UPI001E64C147|nr:T9SS type A sorting domain-containing protein [Chryseobacterium sp. FH1]
MALTIGVKAQYSSGTVNLSAASMTVKLETSPTTATITLIGDSNSMLGIGFGNMGMASGSDGFIYNSSSNRDYTFSGFTAPTADAVQDWTQTSNTVSGSTRTVVATRTLTGGTGDFAIANAAGAISIFYARTAGGQTLGYHGGSRGYSTLNMVASLGTDDVSAKDKNIAFYPNPAKDIVTFKNPALIESVEIYESTGRKIRSIKLDGDRINISGLKNGIYYLEINLSNRTQSVEKLIKN